MLCYFPNCPVKTPYLQMRCFWILKYFERCIATKLKTFSQFMKSFEEKLFPLCRGAALICAVAVAAAVALQRSFHPLKGPWMQDLGMLRGLRQFLKWGYNIRRIYEKAKMIENVSLAAFHKVDKLSSNSTTHKIDWFFKGVWRLYLSLHHFAGDCCWCGCSDIQYVAVEVWSLL